MISLYNCILRPITVVTFNPGNVYHVNFDSDLLIKMSCSTETHILEFITSTLLPFSTKPVLSPKQIPSEQKIIFLKIYVKHISAFLLFFTGLMSCWQTCSYQGHLIYPFQMLV